MEAYLFDVHLLKEVSIEEVGSSLRKQNFILMKSDEHSQNYEQKNSNSILECRVFNYGEKQKHFFLRFCVSNPLDVVEDLFKFFRIFNEQIAIKVHDRYLKKIVFDKETDLKQEVYEKAEILKEGVEKAYGKADRPINCNDYWKFSDSLGIWEKQD